MSNNQTSKKLNFLQLLSNESIVCNHCGNLEWQPLKKVEIPIIQRDYAQGREGKEELRKNFLGALRDAVVNQKPLELDFVYGNVKDTVLQPLDGQQRLTTLFLLYWFIAVKENRLNVELKNILTKFTYETRTSSREFCIDLINKGIVYNSKQNISEQIIDSSWFFLSWKRDPTIKSMLTMLDDIQQTFRDKTEVWDKLNNISFHYIELQNFGLSDDLYIKMNARGKPLTDFENFKAKFEQHIKQNNWEKDITSPQETFAHKIDSDWTDLFWNYRNDENVFDEQLLNFIAGVAMLNYAANEEIFDDNTEKEAVRIELEQKSKNKNITDGAIKRERIERRIASLLNAPKGIKPEDIHTSTGFDFLKQCFNVYSINNNDKLYPQTLNLWDYANDTNNLFVSNIGKVKNATYKQRVLFYAQTKYLLSPISSQDTFSDWMRVVRNIVENSTIDSATTFIGAINLIKELSKGCNDVYDFLDKNSIQSKFAEEQVKEEIRKAKLIVNDYKIKTILFELEDTSFCKGTINWCLEYSDKIEELKKIKGIINSHLKENDITNLFRRALLTIGNNDFYNYWVSWSYSTDTHKKCLIENRNDLKNSFTKNDQFDNYLKPLIIQLCNNDNDLQGIVDSYTCLDVMPNWKCKLIKQSDLLDEKCEGHYMGITSDDKQCYLYGWKKRPTSRDECYLVE